MHPLVIFSSGKWLETTAETYAAGTNVTAIWMRSVQYLSIRAALLSVRPPLCVKYLNNYSMNCIHDILPIHGAQRSIQYFVILFLKCQHKVSPS